MANGVNMIEEYLPGLRAMKCNPERLVFSPYSSEQLETIILQRLAGTGVLTTLPGSRGAILPKNIIQFCAKKVASISGDARKALDACRRALEGLTENAGVGMRDMMRVLKDSFGSRTQDKIESLPMNAKLILCLTAVMQYGQSHSSSQAVPLARLRIAYRQLGVFLRKKESESSFDGIRSLLMHLTECGMAICRDSKGVGLGPTVLLKIPFDDVKASFKKESLFGQLFLDPKRYLGNTWRL